MDVEIRPAKSLKIDTPCPSQGVFLRPEEVDALIVESQRSLSLYAMVLEDGGSQMEGFGESSTVLAAIMAALECLQSLELQPKRCWQALAQEVEPKTQTRFALFISFYVF